jgi:hypothetical protein
MGEVYLAHDSRLRRQVAVIFRAYTYDAVGKYNEAIADYEKFISWQLVRPLTGVRC